MKNMRVIYFGLISSVPIQPPNEEPACLAILATASTIVTSSSPESREWCTLPMGMSKSDNFSHGN